MSQTANVAKRTDVAVVGGGLAGLVAAAVVARAGHAVVLLERSNDTGGRAATEELAGGFYFNLGPHALYRKGAGQRILRELGVRWTGNLPPTRNGLAVYRDAKYYFPTGILSLLATRLLSWSEKIELARLLSTLPRTDAREFDRMSLGEWIERQTKHERAAMLLKALMRVTTYTNDPERMSAGAAIKQLKIAIAGNVDYLDGGWQTLCDGAARAATDAGAKLLTNASVVKIRRAGDAYEIHLRSGDVYNASQVVLATSPTVAARLLEGGEETVLRKWADEAVPIKAACLDIALHRLPNPRRGFYALGIDKPLYLSVHSESARLAPEGGALVHLMKYLETDSEEDSKAVRRELEALLDSVQPGWRAHVAHVRYLPRITVSNALVTAKQGGTGGRPGPEVPGIAGLYVAGDWVGAEGMLLDAAVSSAHHAAQLVSARLRSQQQRVPEFERKERLIA